MIALDKKTSYRLFVIGLIFLFSLAQGQGINNGDWHRTAGVSAGIIPEPWQPPAAFYPIEKEQQLQPLSLGILATGISYLMKDMGINYFPSALVFVILNAIFAIGLILFTENFRGVKKYLSLASILLIYLCFGFYEKSLYEEAAILAALPWVCIGVHAVKNRGRCSIYTVSTIFVLIAKIQMLFCVPIFICFLLFNSKAAGGLKKLLIPLFLIVAAPIFAIILLSGNPNKIPNAYNRFYNGIGWSIMHSHTWPGREFNEKHAYFYAHRDAILEEIDAEYGNVPYRDFLGTSFWPTGDQLLMESQGESALPGERNMANAVISQGFIKSYALYIANNPEVLVKIAKNTYLTAAQSNYMLGYIQTPPVVSAGIFKLLRDLKRWLCANWGLIFFAAISSGMAFGFRWQSFLIGTYVLLLPLFVVFGDGFYEFEKHLSSYILLAPAFFMLLISKNDSVELSAKR